MGQPDEFIMYYASVSPATFTIPSLNVPFLNVADTVIVYTNGPQPFPDEGQ